MFGQFWSAVLRKCQHMPIRAETTKLTTYLPQMSWIHASIAARHIS